MNLPVSLEHCPQNLLSNFWIFAGRWEVVFQCSFNLCFFFQWGWASFHLFKCHLIFIFKWTVFWTIYTVLLCFWPFSSLFLRALYILSVRSCKYFFPVDRICFEFTDGGVFCSLKVFLKFIWSLLSFCFWLLYFESELERHFLFQVFKFPLVLL